MQIHGFGGVRWAGVVSTRAVSSHGWTSDEVQRTSVPGPNALSGEGGGPGSVRSETAGLGAEETSLEGQGGESRISLPPNRCRLDQVSRAREGGESLWKRYAGGLFLAGCVAVGMSLHVAGTALHANHPIVADSTQVTLERELELGSHCQRKATSGRPSRDAEQEHRVARVGQTLLTHARRSEIPYQVRLENNQRVNAQACSNGALLIERNLARKLDDQELLFVGGHELGHVELRHGATRTSYLDQVGWIMAVPIMREPFARDYEAMSRTHEKAADCYAVGILRAEGIPVEKAESALLKATEGSPQHGTHPPMTERLQHLRSC